MLTNKSNKISISANLVIGDLIPFGQTVFTKNLSKQGKFFFADIKYGRLYLDNQNLTSFISFSNLNETLYEHNIQIETLWVINYDIVNNNSIKNILTEGFRSSFFPHLRNIVCLLDSVLVSDYINFLPTIRNKVGIRLIELPGILISIENTTDHVSLMIAELICLRDEIEKKAPTYWQLYPFPIMVNLLEKLPVIMLTNDFLYLLNELKEIEHNSIELIQVRSNNIADLKEMMEHFLDIKFTTDTEKTDEYLVELTTRIIGHFKNNTKAIVQRKTYWIDSKYNKQILLNFPSGYFKEQWSKKTFKTDFPPFKEKKISEKSESRCYWVSDQGKETVLIINALGLTIDFWNSALRELSTEFKVIVWETRCCNLFAGGMRSVVSIEEHVADIFTILDKEKINKCHLIGWCNGGRIAVKAAASRPDQISSLILLSPSFRGITGVSATDTKFESELDEVFRGVISNEKIADMFSAFLINSNRKQVDLNVCIKQILSMVDYSFKEEVISPMKSGNDLMNYARRTFNDEQYPIRQVISNVPQPVLFLLGSEDAITSNELTCSVASMFKSKTICVVAAGSHYVQLQQPIIFSYIASNFINGTLNSVSHPRLSFSDFSGTESLNQNCTLMQY